MLSTNACAYLSMQWLRLCICTEWQRSTQPEHTYTHTHVTSNSTATQRGRICDWGPRLTFGTESSQPPTCQQPRHSHPSAPCLGQSLPVLARLSDVSDWTLTPIKVPLQGDHSFACFLPTNIQWCSTHCCRHGFLAQVLGQLVSA